MIIEFDATAVYNHLATLNKKSERLNYLIDYLFELRKKKAEFSGYGENELKTLMIETNKDFLKYTKELKKGHLIYWNGTKNDLITAKQIGIKDLPQLQRRLKLEFEINDLNSKINFFIALIEKTTSKIILKKDNKTSAIKPTTLLNKIKEPENKHYEIFVNGYGYQMFLEWHEIHKNKKNQLANYSFLINTMKYEKLILDVRPGAYLDFLNEYEISIIKIKDLAEIAPKKDLYSEIKQRIKTKYNWLC